MQLFLMRHGIAADLDEKIGTDGQRPLTAAGKRRVAQVAHGLGVVVSAPIAIATSPLLRARQTAQIVSRQLHGGDGVEPLVWAELESAEPVALLKRLRGCSEPRLLLVGHEPGMSRLVAHLLTGTADGMVVEFKKGAVCALDVRIAGARVDATLLWHAPPRLLRRV